MKQCFCSREVVHYTNHGSRPDKFDETIFEDCAVSTTKTVFSSHLPPKIVRWISCVTKIRVFLSLQSLFFSPFLTSSKFLIYMLTEQQITKGYLFVLLKNIH